MQTKNSACLFQFLLFIALAIPQFASATIIEDLISDLSLAPIEVALDTPDGATNINGTLHVVGQHNGQAARQLIDLATGTAGQVEYFDSFLSESGGNGSSSGFLHNVVQLDDGRVLYTGSSAGLVSVQQQTFWYDPTNPMGETGVIAGSQLRDASNSGLMVGFDQAAIVRRADETHENLPGFAADVAVDITTDGSYIVGSYIWNANALGGYDVVDTSNFDTSRTDGELPTWVAVEIDPVVGEAVFAGSYFDLNTFTSSVGFWREDGSFIGAAANSDFRDFEVWEGQLVAGVVDATDTHLYAISDFSTIALASILGIDSLLFDDGLFVGSAGFLTAGANGAFVTSYVTNDPNGGGGGTQVPEPTTVMLLGSALGFAARRRRVDRISDN